LTALKFFSTLAIFLWKNRLASAKNLHADLIKAIPFLSELPVEKLKA